MKYSCLVLLFVSFFGAAGLPTKLTYEEVEKRGVYAVTWDRMHEHEKENYPKYYLCIPVTIIVPSIDLEHPKNTNVSVNANVYVEDKLLISSRLSNPVAVNNTDFVESSGCLPLDKEYSINIVYSYHQGGGVIEFCPPAYEITDLAGFVKSVYNKPLKRD